MSRECGLPISRRRFRTYNRELARSITDGPGAVDATEPSDGLLDHLLHIRLDGHIGRYEAGGLTQSPRKLFTQFAPTSGYYDPGSLFNEQRRSTCADAARSAGDDRDLPFKR